MRDPLSFLVILFSVITEVSDQSKKTVLNLVKATMHSVKTNRLFSQGPQGGFKTTSKNIKNSKVLFILILVMSHCATVVVN